MGYKLSLCQEQGIPQNLPNNREKEGENLISCHICHSSFLTYTTIACHATFFIIKLSCCPILPPCLSHLWKNKDNLVKSIIKSGMGCKYFFLNKLHVSKQIVKSDIFQILVFLKIPLKSLAHKTGRYFDSKLRR